MGNRNKNGYPVAAKREAEINIYCEDWVRLKLKVTTTRGRRRMAKVLAPDAKYRGHVILDRPLAGSYTWLSTNLEVVPQSWVDAKERRSSPNRKD